MKTFKDADGREWTITVDIGALRRIRDLTKVDLVELIGNNLALALDADPVLLVDVLWAAVKPQAEQRKISDEEFGCSLRGEALDAALAALLEDLVDFFPERKRAMLRRALAWVKKTQTEALGIVGSFLDDPAAMEKKQQELMELLKRKLYGERSTKSPGSSESTPTD